MIQDSPLTNVSVDFVGSYDDDKVTLHSLRMVIPEHRLVPFKEIIANPNHTDPQMEVVANNLLTHGAKLHGEPAVEIKHFPDHGAMAVYRALGPDVLDEAFHPTPMLDQHYNHGKNTLSIEYDHAGMVKNVIFGDMKEKQIKQNFGTKAELLGKYDITNKAGAPVIDIDRVLSFGLTA